VEQKDSCTVGKRKERTRVLVIEVPRKQQWWECIFGVVHQIDPEVKGMSWVAVPQRVGTPTPGSTRGMLENNHWGD
jgi:hypothetical protein